MDCAYGFMDCDPEASFNGIFWSAQQSRVWKCLEDVPNLNIDEYHTVAYSSLPKWEDAIKHCIQWLWIGRHVTKWSPKGPARCWKLPPFSAQESMPCVGAMHHTTTAAVQKKAPLMFQVEFWGSEMLSSGADFWMLDVGFAGYCRLFWH